MRIAYAHNSVPGMRGGTLFITPPRVRAGALNILSRSVNNSAALANMLRRRVWHNKAWRNNVLRADEHFNKQYAGTCGSYIYPAPRRKTFAAARSVDGVSARASGLAAAGRRFIALYILWLFACGARFKQRKPRARRRAGRGGITFAIITAHGMARRGGVAWRGIA